MFRRLILSTIFISTLSFSQPIEKPLSLGFGAGPTIGAGFVGRYEWEKWGIQSAFLPYYTSDSATFLEGVNCLYTIDRNKHGSFYLSTGVVGWHRMRTDYIWPVVEQKIDENGIPQPSNPIVQRNWSHGFAAGPGFGMKFNFLENYVFSLDLPAAFVFEVSGSQVKFDSFKPWPNVVFLYNF